jgi:hypothetical protein
VEHGVNISNFVPIRGWSQQIAYHAAMASSTVGHARPHKGGYFMPLLDQQR